MGAKDLSRLRNREPQARCGPKLPKENFHHLPANFGSESTEFHHKAQSAAARHQYLSVTQEKDGTRQSAS